MKLALIVAAAANGVIGRNNQLPWHLPEDLQYFKAKTLGKPIIMGRKTYESIGRPLPGRPNIVVTRNGQWQAPGVHCAGGLKEALELAATLVGSAGQDGEVMVIGGAELYKLALPMADRVYLTRLGVEVEGDACFPDLDPAHWQLVSDLPGAIDAALPHRFLCFERPVNK